MALLWILLGIALAVLGLAYLCPEVDMESHDWDQDGGLN